MRQARVRCHSNAAWVVEGHPATDPRQQVERTLPPRQPCLHPPSPRPTCTMLLGSDMSWGRKFSASVVKAATRKRNSRGLYSCRGKGGGSSGAWHAWTRAHAQQPSRAAAAAGGAGRRAEASEVRQQRRAGRYSRQRSPAKFREQQQRRWRQRRRRRRQQRRRRRQRRRNQPAAGAAAAAAPAAGSRSSSSPGGQPHLAQDVVLAALLPAALRLHHHTDVLDQRLQAYKEGGARRRQGEGRRECGRQRAAAVACGEKRDRAGCLGRHSRRRRARLVGASQHSTPAHSTAQRSTAQQGRTVAHKHHGPQDARQLAQRPRLEQPLHHLAHLPRRAGGGRQQAASSGCSQPHAGSQAYKCRHGDALLSARNRP